MSGWEIVLFFFLFPKVFLTITWCSDSQHLSHLFKSHLFNFTGPMYLCFAKTRCPFSLFCLRSTHLISYLKLCRSQVSLFRWASPHINTWITLVLPIVLTLPPSTPGHLLKPSKSVGLEGLSRCSVAIYREMRLLRTQMQMEIDFSPMLEGSFSLESRVSVTHLLLRVIS